MRLLVSKFGGRFVTRSHAHLNSKSGEQGETEGLIRYLTKEHDVVFFGKYTGEELCKVIEPHVAGMDEMTSIEQQQEGFRQDEAAFGDWRPEACLMVAGYSVTMCMVNNPKHTQVQASSIRYCAPIINLLHHFEIPRFVINNDPRTYPKDQEMSLGWDYARPAALLDQTSGDKMCVVGGTNYARRSVWARPESWAYHHRRENTRQYRYVVIAHAHIKDGCGATIPQAGRAEAWRNILEGSDIAVFGNGWEHYPYGVNYAGVLNPSQVMDMFNTCVCSPCVAQQNFYTGKVYVCEAQGCIPILYGDGSDPYTWDPKGVFIPLDSPMRIRKPGDLLRISYDIERNYEDWRLQWAELCKPDFTMLDDMLSDMQSMDWRSRKWWTKWGGYWRCS